MYSRILGKQPAKEIYTQISSKVSFLLQNFINTHTYRERIKFLIRKFSEYF